MNEPQKQLQRIGIFQQVRSLKESILLGSDFEGHGECFWWTACGAIVLRRYGLKPVIQAGDAQWPILDPKCDDGKCSTHFSYMWSERDPNVSKMNMLLGGLPEIHTWLGLVETQELIDFSTGGIREQAEKHGLKWTAPDLPNFIWSNSKELPEEVHYRPIKEATLFIHHYLQNDQSDPMQLLRAYAKSQRVMV